MTGVIYKYTSPSGKCYIGQTVNETRRKYGHRNNAFNGNHKDYDKPFYRAIRKYGWDSFEYEILNTASADTEKALTDKLDALEIYYIGLYDSYNNGYNSTIGGHSLRGKNHPSYGTKLNEVHKAKLKASRARIVSQYSLDGNYIDTYDSAAQASEVTGADSSRIIAVCRGKQKSAGGYQWRYGFSIESIPAVSYKEPVRVRKFGKDNPRSKTVYQYTLDYELVKIWESGCQAEREAGFDSTKISRVCNHKLPYYGKKNEDKYLWSFSELHDTETED